PQLHALNAEISSLFDCEDKYPEYKPHLTIAYINPAFSKGYSAFRPDFLNKELSLDKAEFHNKRKEISEIPLGKMGTKNIKAIHRDISDRSIAEGINYSVFDPRWREFYQPGGRGSTDLATIDERTDIGAGGGPGRAGLEPEDGPDWWDNYRTVGEIIRHGK